MPIKIKINGRDVECEKGELVIQVGMDHGTFIPHFCWHPGLSPEGNCRMCLVKTSTSRKLEPACMMRAAENMSVETETPEVQKARKDVLEFLLVNHPLDCPICDKAGECLLQDYTYSWRGGLSRFISLQAKTLRATKDVGPGIRFWGNRCVTCTRCVRFLNEVSGTGELTVVNRGDHSTIDAFPGFPVDNPLSLNIVDICPVGALIDKNFLFQARVWYTQQTKSACASCSRGCNVTITALDNDIKRMQPRLNKDVNGHWMCDEGRNFFRYVASDRRLKTRRGTPAEVIRAIRQKGGGVAAVCSSYNTSEELFMFKKLVEALKVETVGFLTLTRGERQTFKSGFVIEADKTPNRKYLEQLFGEQAVMTGVDPIISKMMDGQIKALLVMNGIPDFKFATDFIVGARRCDFVAAIDILQSPLSELAHVVLPGCTWAEKDGTFVNVDSRVQRIRKAVQPPGDSTPELETLQAMLKELDPQHAAISAEGVFREAFDSGATYATVGELGMKR